MNAIDKISIKDNLTVFSREAGSDRWVNVPLDISDMVVTNGLKITALRLISASDFNPIDYFAWSNDQGTVSASDTVLPSAAAGNWQIIDTTSWDPTNKRLTVSATLGLTTGNTPGDIYKVAVYAGVSGELFSMVNTSLIRKTNYKELKLQMEYDLSSA